MFAGSLKCPFCGNNIKLGRTARAGIDLPHCDDCGQTVDGQIFIEGMTQKQAKKWGRLKARQFKKCPACEGETYSAGPIKECVYCSRGLKDVERQSVRSKKPEILGGDN